MIQIDNKVVGTSVLDECFICDLPKCLGACCVHGISGAPLEIEEIEILEAEMENILPYLKPEGVKAIEAQGVAVADFEGEITTPLIDGKECAYCIEENGISFCGIEKAYNAGKTTYLKPISCHLYPIRIKKFGDIIAVNYDRWDICKHAITLGNKEGVEVYKFLKDPIVRHFGEDFYNQLDEAATMLKNQKTNNQ
jgi:hypothetical protein